MFTRTYHIPNAMSTSFWIYFTCSDTSSRARITACGEISSTFSTSNASHTQLHSMVALSPLSSDTWPRC